jgi:hypothetical protein
VLLNINYSVMKYHFESKVVLDVLRKGMWHEDRKVERDLIVKFFDNTNQPVLSKAIEFLEVFYCLSFNFLNIRNGFIDDFDFDVFRAKELLSSGWLDEYKARIGNNVCLIGTAYREHYVLLMDADSAVYGAYDSYLVKIAESGQAAIEAIILGHKSIEIE